jgi:hypothetical protein
MQRRPRAVLACDVRSSAWLDGGDEHALVGCVGSTHSTAFGMIGTHFLSLVFTPGRAFAPPLYPPLCNPRFASNHDNFTPISLPLFVRRPFGKSRGCALSATLQHAAVHESTPVKGKQFSPLLPRTACLVTVRAWAAVGLPPPKSTTNLHGPPSLPKNLQCCRRALARKRHLTRHAGSPEQAFSPTPHEQSRPPPPNQLNIIRLHLRNTSTSPLPPPGLTTPRHTAMIQEILVPVHLGILNSSRPSRRHQRVHLISSLHPCPQTLPSVCITPAGYPQSARLRILPFARHPKAKTKIATRTPIEVVNGTGHLMPTLGRPLGKSAGIPITPRPSVETSKNV